jgi:uncharacterized protein YndB with AHSA1/START domain
METKAKTKITIETAVNAPVEKVWKFWTQPEHITQWNSPSNDWHTPRATNDLRVGGKFTSRMEARDGSQGFDFEGKYTAVTPNNLIEYGMADGREVSVKFKTEGNKTIVTETFDPETENPVEFQKAGWQAILDNFKNHTESH